MRIPNIISSPARLGGNSGESARLFNDLKLYDRRMRYESLASVYGCILTIQIERIDLWQAVNSNRSDETDLYEKSVVVVGLEIAVIPDRW